MTQIYLSPNICLNNGLGMIWKKANLALAKVHLSGANERTWSITVAARSKA
jgi:hypothetical protein